MKGIDIVRRDWSELTRIYGNKVLDLILTCENKDELAN